MLQDEPDENIVVRDVPKDIYIKTPTKMTKARFSCCPIHTFTILHMNICRPQLLLLVNHVGEKKLSISVLLMHVGQ